LHDLDGDLRAVLLERYMSLTTPNHFKTGDLVCWKPGLKNCRVPAYGMPAVALEVLAGEQLDNEQESGSLCFREPLSLVLGVFWDREPRRGDFMVFHFDDGRRFERWNPETS
jgi:hypothetical protein